DPSATFVEVARVLPEQRREYRTAKERSRHGVSVIGAVALPEARCSLPIGVEVVLSLLHSRDSASQHERHWVDSHLPGESELLFRAERLGVRHVTDIKIRHHAKDTLLLLILHLTLGDFLARKFDLHLRVCRGQSQGDLRSGVTFPGTQ